MATSPTITDPTVVETDEGVELKRPLSINIQPILESVAGKLTDDEIDQWFVGFARANEGRGFYLEMTAEGELTVHPMVNMDSGNAEVEAVTDVTVWARENGGMTFSSRTIVRLPDGTRTEPDASWLSPEQLVLLGPISSRAITVCPAFVAEIMSGTDTLPPLQRKMERYIANGAQLGWLIDPYHRRVHVYRPDVEIEVLEDPETVSGDPVMAGFVFEVRRRIFSLHETAAE